jgi:hypothetical protein
MVRIAHNHYGAHVFHVGGNGKAEQQHHDYRHAKQDKHGALVADNVLCFLDNERNKLLHCILNIVMACV